MSTSESPENATVVEIDDRVFIRNLDYHATNEQLEAYFQEKGYQLTSAEIPKKVITRGEKTIERALGFGFVDFASKEEADRAVSEVDGTEFNGRPISLKKAHPRKDPSELLEKKTKTKAKKAPVETLDQEAAPKKKTRSRRAKKPVEEASKPKKKAVKVPLSEGTPSKDTVIVTNLPFTTSVEDLVPVFSLFETLFIHVPAKRFPRHVLEKMKEENTPARNKGFAFVKLVHEADVSKLIEQFNGFEFEERTLGLEVAVDRLRETATEEVPVEA
ncbi:hypothetical protein BABINDRAFT_37319 [Babjeviella inositovora NRRL Y-12698]|uniref:RRM domain-containing protein n=1 Tax=Babjeviella inositovora NRRL Y-12698 TaxID=984486 RepID=A0A1E3QPN3_9ASCO|nr:uncharacterized protein BABINDRAFT_37319 [Babjeviella inositovora NRRL Y-12698]ODQ79598.1 hypothetical protein BABINDRAFT_37319 [Babjeviella inositovora NRRL Y-12698]